MALQSNSRELFHLKWDNKGSTPSLGDIKEMTDLMDVSLACGEDQLGAHRVVLAACSPKLRSLLSRHSHRHQHPVIYLLGITVSQVEALLSFMYYGEVNIAQEDLQSFLKVAEELEVKGLVGAGQHSGVKEPGSSRVKTESLDNNSNCETSGPWSEDLTDNIAQKVASWGVLKMNDYLASGATKPQYFKETFVTNLMLAVKNKEIGMRGAAELLGVSYGTLYSRYTELFGCLRRTNKLPAKEIQQLGVGDGQQFRVTGKEPNGDDDIAQDEMENYEDTLMEVPAENILNTPEDHDHGSIVGIVHNYYTQNMF